MSKVDLWRVRLAFKTLRLGAISLRGVVGPLPAILALPAVPVRRPAVKVEHGALSVLLTPAKAGAFSCHA